MNDQDASQGITGNLYPGHTGTLSPLDHTEPANSKSEKTKATNHGINAVEPKQEGVMR
jgi:hypothetical protein